MLIIGRLSRFGEHRIGSGCLPVGLVIDPFWLTLLVKMLASAALIVCASLVVERAGPLVGAMIATLPISAGPNYVYLAMEHGDVFLRDSAVASLVASAATGVFAVAYAALAQRRGLPASLAGAYAVWLAVVLLLKPFEWALAALIGLNAAVFAGCILATRRFRSAKPVVAAGRAGGICRCARSPSWRSSRRSC
jgi:hypothetical protein